MVKERQSIKKSIFEPSLSTTSAQSFSDVLSKLQTKNEVNGLLLIGSGAAGTLTGSSDYDLLVVLHPNTHRLNVLLTYVKDRMADIVFCGRDNLTSALKKGPIDVLRDCPYGFYFLDGKIVFDRDGVLQKVKDAVQMAAATATKPHASSWASQNIRAYPVWWKINYNLIENRRLVDANDAVYQKALQFRLLYSIFDLLPGYFVIRGVPWAGEKAAMRYLEKKDQGILKLFLSCIDQQDMSLKFNLYEELVERIVAPIGAIWQKGEMHVELVGKDNVRVVEEECVKKVVTPLTELEMARVFWEKLVA